MNQIVLQSLASRLLSAGLPAIAASPESFMQAYVGEILSIARALCTGIGGIIVLWGIFELGSSLQGHDGMSMPQALKRIAGGIVLILAPLIISAVIQG